MNPQVTTLLELLYYRVQHQPTQIAYRFLQDGETAETSLTYQALDQQARTIAAHLQARSQAGDRVLLLYPSGLDFIVAFYACLYAEMIAVPAYPPHPNRPMARLESIVNNAQPSVCLTTQTIWQKIALRFSQNPALAQLTTISSDTLDTAQAGVWQTPTITPDTLAFLQYTSGSTGTPKGVMVSHNNLLHNQQMIAAAFEHNEETIVAGWLPLFHDMGLVGNVLQPIYMGIPCILMSPMSFLQKPVRWLQTISRYRATTSGGPNFAYDLCVQKVTVEQRIALDLSSWQVACNGAEPIRAETLQRFAETFAECGFNRTAFYPCYGLAEATLLVSGGLRTKPPHTYSVNKITLGQNRIVPDENEESQSLVGCGHGRLNQQIEIVNPETLLRCSSEEVGEIWVSGPSVAQGYWQQSEETEKIFQAYLADTNEGPFLRTGDLGFLKDGELFVTGRLKDMIIIRGQNHYPQDIEMTVEKCHLALQPTSGAAFSIDVEGTEQLVIVYEVRRTYLRKFKADEIYHQIRQAVSEEHDLQVYAIVLLKPASVPKTTSGKIQRNICRQGFLDSSLKALHQDILPTQPASEAPSRFSQPLQSDQSNTFTANTIQLWLIKWLSWKLNIAQDTIDPAKAFAEYGLDSMTAIELADDLDIWLNPAGLAVDTTFAWSYPTIETLANYIAGELQQLHQPPNQSSPSQSVSDAVQRTNGPIDQMDNSSLDNLASLSEAEIAKLLAAEIAISKQKDSS
ncbi:MAG: AMP-binding protein [Gammaproteobacteria bacterium]|nr:AMP-binding protein [Gammaproteobacteria bacterium]